MNYKVATILLFLITMVIIIANAVVVSNRQDEINRQQQHPTPTITATTSATDIR